MNNEAKLRPFFPLQFFERGDHRHDLFRSCRGVGPIGKKTVAEIFVNNTVAALDDLFATKNPRSNKHVQVFALQLAAQRRKTANVRDQEPAGNILELSQRPLHHVRLVLF